ncbi:hypothetical protein NST74_24265 [Paenibacillus sp. FSL F4-0125]|uniref:hypothetical protein n=1 Tax=Paenibacillus sp. FSL F4-0125 TaxID=2954730 RepID=UPI0030F837B7
MRKSVIVFLVTSLILVACGSNKSPEQVIEGFYKALQSGNFDDAKGYLVDITNYGQSSDDIVVGYQKSYSVNSVDIKGFKVSEMLEYDETHKYASINLWGTSMTGDFDNTDTMMLVKEGSTWKIDNSLVICKDPLDTEPVTFKDSTYGNYATASNFSSLITVNGMGIKGYIENNLSDRKLIVTLNSSIFLITTKGKYKCPYPYPFTIDSGEKVDFIYNFKDVKGEVQGLVIDNVYISDLAGEVGLIKNDKELTINF